MTTRTLQLTDTLYRYLLDNSLREPEPMRRLRAETARLPRAQMQIAPEQGQFIHFLARLIQARRTLEIGVFTGYSALWTALALPPEGRIVGCDQSREWTDVARRYFEEMGLGDRFQLRLGPARESLEALLADEGEGGFDLAFIDADKEQYDAYYELCLRLVRPGGLLLLDNVLWSGSVADETDRAEATESLRRLNAKIRDDTRVDMAMLPIADGLTLVRRR